MKLLLATLGLIVPYASIGFAQDAAEPTHYVRFESGGEVAHGILVGAEIDKLRGGLFPLSEPTGETIPIAEVRLLPPTDARKVFGVGLNFPGANPYASNGPPMFLKLPTSLVGDGEPVALPPDAEDVHLEGELVLVIGKTAKNIDEKQAKAAIFGVTVGNDLSERSWMDSDLQWMRGKASDGFGPVGPSVVAGLDYDDVLLTTRLNGEIVQQDSTANMIYTPAQVVSYLSRYVTLEPGDLVFMGTPGETPQVVSGDEISITIDGIGTLSNRIE